MLNRIRQIAEGCWSPLPQLSSLYLWLKELERSQAGRMFSVAEILTTGRCQGQAPRRSNSVVE